MRSLFILSACAACCFAQGKVSDFLQTKSWVGKVTAKGSGSGSSSGGGYNDVWSFAIDYSIDVTLDTYDPRMQGWTGTFKGTGKIVAQDKATIPNCVETLSQNYNGPLGDKKFFTMILIDPDQYSFYPSDYSVDGVTNTVTLDCAGTTTGTGPASWSPVLSDKHQTLPAPGQPLSGSFITKMNSPMQPLSLPFGGTPAVIDVTITWSFQPGSPDQLEVVVKQTDQYKNWRPQAGQNGTRGNSLDLTAELRNKDGSPLNPIAAYFEWDLTECSQVPGYAMNAPRTNPSTDYDMKLESGADGLRILDPPNAQKAQSSVSENPKSNVTIASYDWGGYAKIKVTANLADGKQIVGYLEGDPSQQEVRLPKRPDGSLVAEKWKTDNHAAGKDDSADDETIPVGDGTPGDGLTLYEEYRGFIVNAKHEEGDPQAKDFFVVNLSGASTTGGIIRFAVLSGLSVHRKLREFETSDSRVINQNHNSLHVVDQHAVRVKVSPSTSEAAVANGGPGNPKMIDYVEVPLLEVPEDADKADYWASTVAHELFHSVNVWHHGEGDLQVTWMKTADGIFENGGLILVFWEPTASANDLPSWPVGVPVHRRKGVPQDTHSGIEECVMRYDDGRTYALKDTPSIRMTYPGETAGAMICDSKAGDGINDPDHKPQPRYGGPAGGRGDCVHQILVTDKASAPRR